MMIWWRGYSSHRGARTNHGVQEAKIQVFAQEIR